MFDKIPVLELAKVGFIGLACLIFLLAAMFLAINLIRRNANSASNQMLRTFMYCGMLAIGIAAVAQFATLAIDPHSTYKVVLQFSPDLKIDGLPDPRVQVDTKEIPLDQAILLSADKTIKVGVDAIIKAVRDLQEQTATAQAQAATAKAGQVSAISAFARAQDALGASVKEPAIINSAH